MSATEYVAGTEVIMTITFYDETVSPPVLADPTAATVVIQPGYGAAAIVLSLSNLNHVSTGTFTYAYDTTSVATPATGPVQHLVQAQATTGLRATSLPIAFTVLPAISPLT
jgi:hypothetical protein